METIKLIGTILGGLGLFLLAIGMMTDGLKLAAGSALRTLLAKWSSTPFKGIFSGFFMTAVVQSSSAVTVASLGFVNAGLISMRQALGIIYGANVGTTMTGWLVAMVGFKMNIQAFALPMIGIGMLLKLVKPKDRIASFGLALVGFGLFFVGIDILKGAFEGIVQAFDISKFTADGVSGIVIFLVLGFVMTVLTQSSSASIALTITAASSGMVGIYAAGAMVIGANIGTTSTALLASIGATSNAKRVAAAQVIFNFATAIVALLILPVLFYVITKLTGLFGVEPDPAISLALFHTVFNVLGVLLIYPLNDRLANFLDGRFTTWEEQQSNPRFLDANIAQTPDLAVNALILELRSIAEKISTLLEKVRPNTSLTETSFDQEVAVIKTLSSEVSEFIVNIESRTLSDETSNALATLMRVDQYFLTCVNSTDLLHQHLLKREVLDKAELEKEVDVYFNKANEYIELARNNQFDSEVEMAAQLERLASEHDRLKQELVVSATKSQIKVDEMTQSIDCIGEVLRIAQQWFKAFSRINALENEIQLVAKDRGQSSINEESSQQKDSDAED